MSIQYTVLGFEPRHSEHESPPITTSPLWHQLQVSFIEWTRVRNSIFKRPQKCWTAAASIGNGFRFRLCWFCFESIKSFSDEVEIMRQRVFGVEVADINQKTFQEFGNVESGNVDSVAQGVIQCDVGYFLHSHCVVIPF